MDALDRTAAFGRIQARAARQHHMILFRDLAEAGFTWRMIERLVHDGWLKRVFKGVYLVGAAEASPWQRAVGAWLVAGPAAVLSHSTAAAVHRLPHLLHSGGDPELSVTGSRHPRPSGVRVHRVGALDPADVRTVKGVAVTAPARTLVDLATRLETPLLTRVLDEGAIQRLWTPESIASARRRVGGRRGLAHLDRALAGRLEAEAMDSDLEVRAERALRCLGPFRVHHEAVIGGRVVVVDLALPELRIAVECDGWGTRRRSRGKFDGDRRRGNLLAAHGWKVVHLTSAMSDDEMRASVAGVILQVARGRD